MVQRTQTAGNSERPPGGSAASSENGTDHRTSPVSGSVPRRSTPPRWYRAPMAQRPAESSATSAPALGAHGRSAPGGSCSGLSTPGTSARYSQALALARVEHRLHADQREHEGGARTGQPGRVPSHPGRAPGGDVRPSAVAARPPARRGRGARARPVAMVSPGPRPRRCPSTRTAGGRASPTGSPGRTRSDRSPATSCARSAVHASSPSVSVYASRVTPGPGSSR